METDKIPLRQLDGCINTFAGKKFNLLKPDATMIDVIDIAKGLAYKPHFSGMSPKFFSIAEHSVLVRDLLITETHGFIPELSLAALLHDSAEAYIGDMIKPLKIHLPLYCQIEDLIMNAVFDFFGLDYRFMRAIKRYDLMAQDIEYNAFFKGDPYPLKYHDPEKAYKIFLSELDFEQTQFDRIKNRIV